MGGFEGVLLVSMQPACEGPCAGWAALWSSYVFLLKLGACLERGRPGSFLGGSPYPCHRPSLPQSRAVPRYLAAPPLTLGLGGFEVALCPKLPFIAGVWKGPGIPQAAVGCCWRPFLLAGMVGAQPLEPGEVGVAGGVPERASSL